MTTIPASSTDGARAASPGGQDHQEEAPAPAAPAAPASLSERVAVRRGMTVQRQRSTDPGVAAEDASHVAGAPPQDPPDDEEETCRICLGTDNLDGQPEPLLDHQCACSGSVDRVHLSCLTSWVVERRSLACELCKSTYKEPTLSHLKAALIQHPPRSHHNQQGQDALGVLTLGGDNGDAARESVMSWQNIMCHVLVLVVLLAVILYLTVFSSIAPSASSSDWTSILWRVLTILIPVYLVVRMSAAVWSRYRQERATRQQQQQEAARGGATEVAVDPELGLGQANGTQHAQHEVQQGGAQQVPIIQATTTPLAGSVQAAAHDAPPALTGSGSDPAGTIQTAAAAATASEGAEGAEQQGMRLHRGAA